MEDCVVELVRLGVRVVRNEIDGNAVVALERDAISETVAIGLDVSRAVSFDEALALFDGRRLAETTAVAVLTAVPFELADTAAVVLASAVRRADADSEFDSDVLGVTDDDGRALLVVDADLLVIADALGDALPLNVGRTLAEADADRVAPESVGRGLFERDGDAVALTKADAERPLEGETLDVDEALNETDDDPL